jgi:flagellar basal-body rod modification protein FlgD
VDLGIALSESASEVNLSILDENNSVITSLTLSNLEAGDNFFNWDGCDAAGNALASGEYSLSVSATNGDSSVGTALPLVKSSVNEVALSSAGSVLVTDAGEVLLSEIYAVVGRN